MKRFEHTIHDHTPVHTGQIAKIAKRFADTVITVSRGGKSARASAMLRLLCLGIRGGDTVTVTVEGPNEMAATIAMQNFFWNHM